MLNNATRFLLSFLFMLAFGMHTIGQNLTQSPYSVVGFGDMLFQGTSQQSAMGQISQGYRRPYEINNMNPASYSSLSQTVFEAGYLYSQGQLSSSSSSTTIDNASFAYFNLGIPISQRYGISLVSGLLPYSAIGYNISSSQTYPGSPGYVGTTQMQGRGGLSRFYMGTSFRLHKNFSIGINVNYLFGTINRNQQLVFDTSYHKFNISEERSYSVHSLAYQIGLQFHKSLNDKYKVTAGLTYDLGSNLDATYSFTNRSLGWGGTSLFTLDTIDYFSGKTGYLVLPQTIRTGLTFERKGVWMIGADMSYTQWSAFRAFGVSDNMTDNMTFSIGASIVPNVNKPKNYLNTIEYRIGTRYDNGNVKLYNQAISGYAFSAGLGFPMGKSKSRLNLTAEYISQGTTNSNLLRQDLFRMILGVTFSDQWFIRYKYD